MKTLALLIALPFCSIANGAALVHCRCCANDRSSLATAHAPNRSSSAGSYCLTTETHNLHRPSSADSIAPFQKQTTVTDSADVKKMVDKAIGNATSQEHQAQMAGERKLSTNLFQLGDVVLYKIQFYGRIISIEPNDMVTLSYTKNDSTYTKKVSISKIYTLNRSYRDYRIGEEYYYISDNVGKGERKKVGVVVAVGLNALVVKNRFGRLEIYPYVN